MAIQVQLRRGTTAQNAAFTGAVGEVTVDTDKDTAVVHDGSTAGGFPLVGEKGTQTITGVKTFDNGLATDTISEETSAAGVTIDGALLKDGGASVSTLNTSGQVVFNDAGADVDFRVEGDTDANLLFVDASTDRVGIGTSSPTEKLTVSGNASLSGNLTFTGTGNRITGDFSNATHANRVAFQTSTTNGATTPFFIPNGTGNTASVVVANASDPTNSSFGQLAVNGTTDVRIVSSIIGTGTFLPMTFHTGGSERMRIDTSGNLLVGTTANAVAGYSAGKSFIQSADYSGVTACLLNSTSTTGLQFFLVFGRGGTQCGQITSGSTNSTSYTTSSDYRLKKDVQPMTGALAKVQALKPCTYKWIQDNTASEGFIAHELAETFPQAVVGEKDAVDAKGNPQYQGVDTSFLVATLTAAIQEQQTIIESLKARLDAAGL